MSKHKHKNPRVDVFFKYKGRYYKLFKAINFGSKSVPELKIKELSENYNQICDDNKRFDGMIHEGQTLSFIEGKHVEFTYHKDGSVLAEIIRPSKGKIYHNPYGEGERWTPLIDIKTFQPVMIFIISSLASYHYAFPEDKRGLINYFIKNERIFEITRGQGLMVLVYLRNKNFPLVKYCFDDTIYSDIVMGFGEELDLCIMIQKQSGPNGAGSWHNNGFLFLDRLDGFEYMKRVLCNHIFDPVMAEFMSVVQKGDCYFDISEKMMQVIESVDPFYKYLKENSIPIKVHKPVLVRALLDVLDGKYDEYLKLPKNRQLQHILGFYIGVVVGFSEFHN